jgi:small-conductance mechanosensitive channel
MNGTVLLLALLQVRTQDRIFEYFTPGRIAIAIVTFVVAWLTIRYVSKLLDMISVRSPRIRFLSKLVEPVLRILLWFIAILLSFDLLAPTQETFFAAIGSVAIAIGLGSQDLIKNLIGGFVILGDRPYQIGDRVRVGDADGEIVHIGLRSTKLLTLDDTRITIPNAMVLDNQIVNANSGTPICQAVTELYVPIGADPEQVIQIGYEAACTSPYLSVERPVVVQIADGFSDSPYMLVRVKAYVFDHRFVALMKTDVAVRAKKEFIRRGVLGEWANRNDESSVRRT